MFVDQGGRALGPRALRTRRRILEATRALLAEKPMRDLRVIDIARRIGSSPATFYQYFKDVEGAVLELASQTKEATPLLVALIDGDWEGEAGYERGKQIARQLMDHWARNAPVLRVRNNASDEGNLALRRVRVAAMRPLVEAFQQAIERSRENNASEPEAAAGWSGGAVDPMIGGTALASLLERMSMYQLWIEDLGRTQDELIETMATLMQMTILSRR
jgi:AcrR family transcriptional regulator